MCYFCMVNMKHHKTASDFNGAISNISPLILCIGMLKKLKVYPI
jgi:hypothetical protein